MDLKLIVRDKLIRVLFQPIYDYRNKKIIGYEALSKGPKGSFYEDSGNLFDVAKNEGMQGMLEMACFRKALFEYRSKLFKSGALLFLNFHPDVEYGFHCEEPNTRIKDLTKSEEVKKEFDAITDTQKGPHQ